MNLPDCPYGKIYVVIKIGEQVCFVEQCRITHPKHQRILGGLIFAFGYGQNHHPSIFTDIKFRRAHQVADILHDEQINGIQVQAVQGLFNHMGRQMAVTTELVGIDLDHRGP